MRGLSLLLIFSNLVFQVGCDLFKDSHRTESSTPTLIIPQEAGWISTSPTHDQLKNKIVILNFWASWCAPCQEETPALLKLVAKNPSVVLISISGDNSLKDMKKFMSLFPHFKGESIFVAHDVGRNWIQKHAVTGFPETFVYDTHGQLKKRYQGSVNFLGDEFQSLLQ